MRSYAWIVLLIVGWTTGVAAQAVPTQVPAAVDAAEAADATPPASPEPVSASAPATTVVSPASAEASCFPACRSAYVCHLGQCISACNPPCEAGERCTAEGECALRTPIVVSEDESHETTTEPSAAPHSSVQLDLGLYAGNRQGTTSDGGFGKVASFTALTTSVSARVVLSQWALLAEVPFVVNRMQVHDPLLGSDDPTTALRIGNPMLGAQRIVALGEHAWVALGLALTAPLSRMPTEHSAARNQSMMFAMHNALFMRGYWNAWLFMADRFALVLPVELQARVSRVVLGSEVSVAQLLGITKRMKDTTIFQVGLRALVELTPAFALGVRARLAFDANDLDGRDDHTQASLEPLLQVTTADGWFFGAGWLMNLDNPAGLGETGRQFVWCLRVTAGYAF